MLATHHTGGRTPEPSTETAWDWQAGPHVPQIQFMILLLSRVVEMEKYRCFLGTTRKNCCSLSMRNAKDKRQSEIVLSPPGGGFEPRTSAT